MTPLPEDPPRPRPVLIYGVAIAVLTALTETADATDLLPAQVFPWVRLVLVVVTAIGGALWAQSKVTPLASPQNNNGVPLVPDANARGTGYGRPAV